MVALNWVHKGIGNKVSDTPRGKFRVVRIRGKWSAYFGNTELSGHETEGAAKAAAQEYFDFCEQMDPELTDSGMGWSQAIATLLTDSRKRETTISNVQTAIDTFRKTDRVSDLRTLFPVFAIQTQEMLLNRVARLRDMPQSFSTDAENAALKLEYLYLANKFLRFWCGHDGGMLILENDGHSVFVRWVRLG